MKRRSASLCFVLVSVVTFFSTTLVPAADEALKIDTSRGDRMIAEYFEAETARLEKGVLDEIKTKDDWVARKDELRRQLHEMLGLDPLPEKTPLKATVTGTVDHPEFTVEKLHFQSRPRLYVTGNLYVPKGLEKPAPAILYVCGHGNVKKNGVSYGSKANYQHHGAWFARHGYVCLVIDTLQLGEIEGLHHGTYREGMYWWWSRGYTPAGVEAWNCIRALDYLQSRKEVDGERLGVTGRSGGGAYSWWIAALDERIKAAVPVAGITDLRNHVVDGVVEGHCDCMFMVNTYRWDYGTVAALVAPRPLLLTNTDDDRIFPLDGVERIHWQLRKIYGLLGASKDLGLQISWGGHYDTQELQVAAMRWFNLHLKKADPKIEIAAVKLFEPEQLKVFEKLPEDQINTLIHGAFVPMAAKPKVPADSTEWAAMRDEWMMALKEKVFRGWPQNEPLEVEERPRGGKVGASELSVEFRSESIWRLRVDAIHSKVGSKAATVQLAVGIGSYEQAGFIRPIGADGAAALTAVRGTGDAVWDQTPKKQTQHRRRFALLGHTLESGQVYDLRRAIQALKTIPEFKDAKVTLVAQGPTATIALYAALFEPSVDRLVLRDLSRSHMPTPTDSKEIAAPLFNVVRYLDVPQAVAMAAERATVIIEDDHEDTAVRWSYPQEVAKTLGWKDRVIVRPAK